MLAIVIGRDQTFGGIVMKLATRFEITPFEDRIRIANTATGDLITWREIRIATAERMKEEMPDETYEKYYSEPRLFAWYKQRSQIVEIIDFDEEADTLEIHIMPTANLTKDSLNMNKFMYRHIRMESLRDYPSEPHKVELATLGFYKKNQNRVYLSCIHCGQSNISIEESVDKTVLKHTNNRSRCFLRKKGTKELLKILKDKNMERDCTTIHMIKINRDLIRLNNIQKIMHESARLREDNIPTTIITGSNTRAEYKDPICAICLENKATVLQIPCFHMVLCKSCFQKHNTERRESEDDLDLGNYNPCIMCRHPVNIVTTTFS